MKLRKAVIAGGLAVGLVVLAGCGGDGNDDAAEGASAPTKTAEVHRIGQPVKFGNVEVIVHGITDPFDSGNPVVKAPPGSRQVAVDVEVKNLSSEAQVFSAFKQFEMRDSTNRSFNPIPLPRNIPSFGGGAAPPGSAQRGLVAFNVPEASTGLRIVFQNPLVTEGSVTYTLT